MTDLIEDWISVFNKGFHLDIANAFGAVLRSHRKDRGLSQEELAEICNIERTFVSMLERGERRPSLAMTFDLSKGLGITASSMIAEVEQYLKQ